MFKSSWSYGIHVVSRHFSFRFRELESRTAGWPATDGSFVVSNLHENERAAITTAATTADRPQCHHTREGAFFRSA